MPEREIDILGLGDTPLVARLYNHIYQPARQAEFFETRLKHARQSLILAAIDEGEPVGFFIGYELKPGVFFEWLYGVLPPYRGQGIASRMIDASNAWCRDHQYQTTRLECHNQHRPVLHLAIANQYDMVGIRWDQERQANLVLFEKELDPD